MRFLPMKSGAWTASMASLIVVELLYLQRCEIFTHFGSGLIARVRVQFARFENNFVQLQQQRVSSLEDGCRQVGELQTVFSHAYFVKNFAQAENVGCGSPRAFRGNVSLSSEIRR